MAEKRKIIERSLLAVSRAFKEFSKDFQKGKTTEELLIPFMKSLKDDLGEFEIVYDYIWGKDTLNIDGITDGSYIPKDRRLLGETISIAALDTFVAFVAGLIIIPSCFAFDLEPGQGPGLIFTTLPNLFNAMPGGRIWGILFFVFMVFAAMSTVTAVFENIISFGMDLWGWSRKKACIINTFLVIILSLPCALGFNVLAPIVDLSWLGEGKVILDLEDFIISNNILPLGSIVYVLFCTMKKYGWGWNNFIEEANTGKGIGMSYKLKFYSKYIIPVFLLILWGYGIITIFF